MIFIVPEQFSFQAEKELVRNSINGGVLKNEVLSFGRLCYRIFNKEVEQGRFVSISYIGMEQQHLVVTPIITSIYILPTSKNRKIRKII